MRFATGTPSSPSSRRSSATASPYPQNVEVATASEQAIRQSGAVPADGCPQRRPPPGRPDPRRARGAGDGPERFRAQGLAAQPRRGDRLGRLGRHDRRGHDDRRGRGRHPGVRDRRHRRRAPRCAGRRPADLRHLRRSRGARPDGGGRRLRRPQGDPRRAADARVPRDARRAGRRARQRRDARLLQPSQRHPGTRAVPDVAGAAAVVRAHTAMGLTSGLVICNPVPEADELPSRSPARRSRGRSTRPTRPASPARR